MSTHTTTCKIRTAQPLLSLWVTSTCQTLTGNTTQLIKMDPGDLDDNFLVHVVREPTSKDVLLDLLLVNREGPVDKMAVGGQLGRSDHDVLDMGFGVHQ